ncbi:MAG TPA: prolyl oligopeptidase family serine peptidase [Gaiellaceae bacterium]|nr:prolyl oligopeptidase family serine peptidase [Gaiellaceae bacterium]
MRSLGLSFLTLALVASSACTSDPAPPAAAAGTEGDDAGTEDGGSATGKDAGPTTPPVSDKVTVTTESVDVEGTSREYVLAVPKKLEAGKGYPLVLVFHGDGGTGPGMRQFHTFDAVSGEEAIVAYPTGIGAAWDISSPSATNKDIKFVEALVAAVSGTYDVDAARIFGTGYSSGGFLVNKIACRKTGFFRGIVSHAGGAPYEDQDPGASEWPNGFTKCAGQSGGVAALIMHGDGDGAVTPDSGDFNATYWASINGCQDTRSDTTPAPCQKHDGCPNDKPVLWCLVPGLGHTVWSNGAKEGWAFMKGL